MSIQSFFPFESIRPKQAKVLEEIDQALKSRYKFIFLEAPTGFGKSAVAVTLARFLGSSHICTSTKDLQTQYNRDFPYLSEVKGRNNFPCIIKEDMGISENCEYGPCLKDDNFDCIYKTRMSDYDVKAEGTIYENIEINKYALKKYHDKAKEHSQLIRIEWKPCLYYHQKWVSIKSSHTIYNYKYFLSDLFYSSGVNKRKLLILDEAHTLESELSSFKNIIFSKESLARFFPRIKFPDNKQTDIETWIAFCTTLRDQFSRYIERAANILGDGGSSGSRLVSSNSGGSNSYGGKSINNNSKSSRYGSNNLKEQEEEEGDIYVSEKNLIDALNYEKTLTSFLEDLKLHKDNWLVTNITRNEIDNTISRIKLEPLVVSNYFEDIFDKGETSLLMSATILSKENLCKAVGLKDDDVKFIRVESSDFPIRNRPIYLMNVAWLNAKTMNEALPNIVKVLDNLLTVHKNDKGIIHTTSYSQVQFIKNNLSKGNLSRLIETNPKFDRSEMILKHTQSPKPTVLISPSMFLGVDLKDDLSRFQIIVKVPYPDLTDKKISVLKQRNPKWYEWNTILRLIQAYGRSVRNSEDYANTYILDSSVSYLLKNGRDMVPKWFSEAIITR
ncbi:helicase C-terminal domain-containing protein [Candidatus Nitrosocosmicus franklandus]|uniref:ATP-dependent DNA helicase DinG n=1 Tax=Candidatus Nitrosocosmicus franklandianus TaxID=1798806 RepID=A0A484I987_9ARCH|nr:ATP-dependent DNA helicase [Candidatus Nitrosocosmicus franklandus]VFJ13676.1 ATP-dependent DNA helicase DinG [Candidatus Nitrosocosmicus franklandus]